MSLVHIDERKWPDRLHWQLEGERLGEDEHGVWLLVPRNTVARRGYEPAMQTPYGFVMLIPEAEFWLVEFYWDNPEHPVYVNIGTPPEWHGDRVTQVDLDLDVVRRPDGEIEVVDEDEFLAHQVLYEYPQELIENARVATDRAVGLLTAGVEPFGIASQRWLAMAGHS